MSSNNTLIDVLIVTATKDELDVVRNVESDWQARTDGSGYLYYVRCDEADAGHEISIALARPIDMGGDYTSNVATRLTYELRPRCLAMVGICAGWRDKVFLGDVIVAERVFRYDDGKLRAYQAGEGRITEVFQDIRTYNLKPQWVHLAQDFDGDWINTLKAERPLTYEYQKLWVLYSLDEFENGTSRELALRDDRKTQCPNWPAILEKLSQEGLIELSSAKPFIRLTENGKVFLSKHKIFNPDGIKHDPNRPRVHVAPMGTGNRVIEDEKFFPTVALYERKVLGVEMEGSAVGVVAAVEGVDYCIIAKAVTDYADPQKNDHFRYYAIEASYRFLVAFLKENLPPALTNTTGDSAYVHLGFLRTVHASLRLVKGWIGLQQECQAINLNLIVLLGVMTADNIQLALTDLNNFWVLECSAQVKSFTKFDSKNDFVKSEFANSAHGKKWLNSLRLAAGELDALSEQCVTVEDLRIRLTAIQNRIIELLRINCEILRSLDSLLQRETTEVNTTVETAAVEIK